ncbi:MAG: hypothetical protein RBR56_06870, partial [Halothiobacillus sp.]|nr:hypothetical protein [Halothiobacillus sp.]
SSAWCLMRIFAFERSVESVGVFMLASNHAALFEASCAAGRKEHSEIYLQSLSILVYSNTVNC